MKLRFVWVGRTREKDLARGIERYLDRVRRHADIEVVVVPDAPGSKSRRPEERARREGQAILAKLMPRGQTIGLDPAGEALTSEGFARLLEGALTAGGGHVQFVLGGPTGLPDEVRARLDRQVSLTALTLTHEMARLLLAEQVYRAFTILRGEPYHRGT